MKNYNVTKAMKTKVIHQLVEAYIKSNTATYSQELDKLSSEAWKYHQKIFENATGIQKEKWDYLILRQVLRPYRMELTGTVDISADVRDFAYKYLVKGVQIYGRRLAGALVSPNPVPEIGGFELPETFAAQATPILESVRKVYISAMSLKEELWTVLTPLRTYNRILEVLPEAAALLENPEPKNQVIPVSLVESVRQKLSLTS